MAVDEFGNEILAVEETPTTTVDPVAEQTSTLGEPYEALAEERITTAIPEFEGYTATAPAPQVEAGETFTTPATTVAGQLETILQKGSPLQDLSETRAREKASALGMLSSSAGIGAGQRALYDTALPIAQQDATTAKEFKQQEQGLINEQTKIATEAQVAGDLTVQKARLAEQQKALDDSFALKLTGLDKETEENMLNLKGTWDAKFKELDSSIALQLQQQEIDAGVEALIMNQAHDQMNQYQISIQQLLANQAFLDSMPDRDAMNNVFNDMFQTTVASLEFSASAAGIYDADFQDYLDDLVASSAW